MTTVELTYTECKEIYKLCENLGIDAREVIENFIEDDFEVGNYRFIAKDEIDRIQREELESDEYLLGCFNDWFLADCSNIDLEVIQALQKAGAYEALGKLMLRYIEEIQEAYAAADGYGHHFAHYDHETIEDLLDLGYYVFRTN